MTQWLFEYYALLRRDRQYMDLTHEYIKTLRKMVIDVLGLDVGKLVDKPDFEFVVPLTMLTGTPELISEVLKHAQNEAAAEDATADDDFDALSEYLMERTKPDAVPFDDGDMLPFVEPLDTSANTYAQSDEYKVALTKLVRQRGDVQVMTDDA